MDADAYSRTDLTPAQAAEHDRVFGELAERTRQLMDAQLRTRVDHAEIAEITKALGELTDRLLADATPGSLGVQLEDDGTLRNHGNAVVGLRNPIAPPLHVQRFPEGRSSASFHLNALYEGPPGLVHGGVSALILDQMLGEAAAAGSSPGMTGRLSLSYRRPTPLGALSAEVWIVRVDGVKTTVKGHIKDGAGSPTVEAEGLFILPRWAREAVARARFDRFE